MGLSGMVLRWRLLLLLTLGCLVSICAGLSTIKSNIKSSINSKSNIKKKSNSNVGRASKRKKQARSAAETGMNRKLQADADFFWDCVDLRSRGVDIRGRSGRSWSPPRASSLFGDDDGGARAGAGAEVERREEPEVTVTAKGTRRSDRKPPAPIADFDSLGGAVPAFALANLLDSDRMRYDAPTPVQRHCVPLALAGHDVLASAQTGSGKTVGFLLPLIAAVAGKPRPREAVTAAGNNHDHDRAPSRPSALILAPTRELALQIELEIQKLTFRAPPPPHGSLWCTAVYGGATARPQLEALASGVEILVATPGRLADFIDRDLVSLADCGFLVLDEADRMLDMGFAPQLDSIVVKSDMPTKEHRQTLLFSATFPAPLRAKAKKDYLRNDYVQVAVGTVGASNKAVTQRLIRCDGTGTKQDKLKHLLPLLIDDANDNDADLTNQNNNNPKKTIVFVNKKHHGRWLAKKLATPKDKNNQHPIRVAQIHGDRTQGQRESALSAFRSGSVDVLVATDAVSRGIDIPDVSHVVQFDLPISAKEYESYTHRIGRTGRAGRTGVATGLYVPGMEPKLGNGDLWMLLKASFDEAGMELPDWFDGENEGGDRNRNQDGDWGKGGRKTANVRQRPRTPVVKKKMNGRVVAADRTARGGDRGIVRDIAAGDADTGANAKARNKRPRVLSGAPRPRGGITIDEEVKLQSWINDNNNGSDSRSPPKKKRRTRTPT